MVPKTYLKPTYLPTYIFDSSDASDSSDSSYSSDSSDSSDINGKRKEKKWQKYKLSKEEKNKKAVSKTVSNKKMFLAIFFLQLIFLEASIDSQCVC